MIILCGKTCTGKSTVQNEIVKLGIPKIVTYTTRKQRYGEKNGDDYHFVSREEFFELQDEGFFAETSSYEVVTEGGNKKTQFYGSALKDYVGDLVVVLNPEGLRNIRPIRSINSVVFYLMSDEEILWNRLRQRGDNAMEARRRLDADAIDFSGFNDYIDFSIRTDLNMTPTEIAQLIVHLYNKCKDQ